MAAGSFAAMDGADGGTTPIRGAPHTHKKNKNKRRISYS